MKRKELTIQNKIFEIKSRFNEKTIEIAKVIWSKYRGPCDSKMWFNENFELLCYGILEGLKNIPKISNRIENGMYQGEYNSTTAYYSCINQRDIVKVIDPFSPDIINYYVAKYPIIIDGFLVGMFCGIPTTNLDYWQQILPPFTISI